MKKIKLKELIFDYHSPVDYNAFGGGFKPKGFWILNKQKVFNMIILICMVIIIIIVL
jgi:hypothetical protein